MLPYYDKSLNKVEVWLNHVRINKIRPVFVNVPTQMYIKIFEKKVPGKVGECICDSYKCKSFQGPEAGPGPQPILAHFAHPTMLRYIGKILGKFLAPPDQILDLLLCY